MGQKLHAASDVQLLVNAVMPWAEAGLKEHGQIPALAAWLPHDGGEPVLQPSDAPESPVQEQEATLAEELRPRWQRGEFAATALVAPVFYGKAGSGERSLAVRLHIENRDGYCADILMPYRIRAVRRWRGAAGNRVHFSHPVAQESDSRFSNAQSSTAKENAVGTDDADETQVKGRLHDLRGCGDVRDSSPDASSV